MKQLLFIIIFTLFYTAVSAQVVPESGVIIRDDGDSKVFGYSCNSEGNKTFLTLINFLEERLAGQWRKELSQGLDEEGSFKGDISVKIIVKEDFSNFGCEKIKYFYYEDDGSLDFSYEFYQLLADLEVTIDGKSSMNRFCGPLSLDTGVYSNRCRFPLPDAF